VGNESWDVASKSQHSTTSTGLVLIGEVCIDRMIRGREGLGCWVWWWCVCGGGGGGGGRGKEGGDRRGEGRGKGNRGLGERGWVGTWVGCWFGSA